MDLSLTLVETDTSAVGELAPGYEPNALHGRATLIDALRQAAAAKPWFIYVGDTPVGFVALRADERITGGWTTTTYLDPAWRRHGINRALKTVALAAARDAGKTLTIYAQHDNFVSQSALLRIFPDAVVAPTGESVRFSLQRVPTPSITPELEHLFELFLTRLTDPNQESHDTERTPTSARPLEYLRS